MLPVPRLSEFKGIHHGEAIVVCGLGNSVRSMADPQRFRTIGVNDIERAFTPTYMFCMDAPKSFAPERLKYIQGSRARFVFTDHDLGIRTGNVVRFPIRRAESPRLDDPDALYFTQRPVTSPYIALCLAAHMGAKAIGMIGVDFTNGHFFAADGAHKLVNHLPGIDRRFYHLGSALLERGVKVFNLSAASRLRAFPRLTVEEFWELQESGRARAWTRPATRLYFFSALPLQKNAAAIARLINTHTTLSCRLSAPGSTDIAPGSMPEIEQSVADASDLELDCAAARLPQPAPTKSEFPRIWRRQMTPLLFGRPAAPAPGTSRREMTVRVIVSQEQSTPEELMQTAASLAVDLRSDDEIIAVRRRGSDGVSEPPSAPFALHHIEQLQGESFIAARNRAAARCPQDLVVFTDANVQAPTGWIEPLLAVFRDNAAAAAVGPAIADMYRPEVKSFGMAFADTELNTAALARQHDLPYPVPLLPGTFVAVRRRVFERLGGLDGGMRKSGADDLELCLRLWTSGYQCFIVPQASVAWMNPFAAGGLRPRDYWQDLLHNLLRLATTHFSPERLGAFIARASAHREYAAAAAGLAGADIARRQREIRTMRRYSDDWFFHLFRLAPAS